MNKKIVSLSKERRKRKPQTYDEIAKVAFNMFNDPALLEKVGEEPHCINSGRPNPQGGFIRDDENDALADAERASDE